MKKLFFALLLLVAPAAHASFFHHDKKPTYLVSDKEYTKEVQSIILDDANRTADILKLPDYRVSKDSKKVLSALMALDLKLIRDHLHDFQKKKCTRVLLDKYIFQASRDLETIESVIPPLNDRSDEPIT